MREERAETQLDDGMRPTERQEHVLVAAMMARDDPADAVALLSEHGSGGLPLHN